MKRNPNPLAFEATSIKGFYRLRDPKTLEQAIAIVEETQKVLSELARGFRGAVAPETTKAFRMVLTVARKGLRKK